MSTIDLDVVRDRIEKALAEVGYGGSVHVDEDPEQPDGPFVWFPRGVPDEVKWMAFETARVGLKPPLCFACQSAHTQGLRPDCWATRSFQRDCGRPRDISADALSSHGTAAPRVHGQTGPGGEPSSVTPGPVLFSEGMG